MRDLCFCAPHPRQVFATGLQGDSRKDSRGILQRRGEPLGQPPCPWDPSRPSLTGTHCGAPLASLGFSPCFPLCTSKSLQLLSTPQLPPPPCLPLVHTSFPPSSGPDSEWLLTISFWCLLSVSDSTFHKTEPFFFFKISVPQ